MYFKEVDKWHENTQQRRAESIQLFEHTDNRQAFEKAIKDNLPDEKYIQNLKDKIAWNELKLKKAENDLNKLVQNVLDGKLREDTIKPMEDKIYQEKEDIENRLELLKKRA